MILVVAPGLPAAVQNKLLGEPKLMWAIDPNQINAKTRASMQQRKRNPHF